MPTDDPAKLIEWSRLVHRRVDDVDCECQQGSHPCCWIDRNDWPCKEARLADELEYWHAYAIEWRDVYRHQMAADIETARADATAQRERAEHREKRWRELAEMMLEAYHVNSFARPFHDKPVSECTELLCVNYRKQITALAVGAPP